MKFKRYSRSLPKKSNLINKQIRFEKVMLIGSNGPIGQMSSKEAYLVAQNEGLDLVCVSPHEKPPICKILDYGKFKFDKSKKEKESKKRKTIIVLKEIRLTPNIGDHDLTTKANKARKFIEDKFKVKVSLKYRGRERAHTDVGEATLMNFFKKIEDITFIEKAPYANGRFFDMILSPVKNNNKSIQNNKKTL